MISRLHLSALLAVAAVVGGAVLVINGAAVRLEWLGAVSATVTVVSLALLAFQHWIWRWRLLHGWFVEVPDLRGTWRITLKSDWVDPETKKRPADIEGYLAVRQTYTNLSLRLMTSESSSKLIGSSIHRAEDGLYEIIGVYQSHPKLSQRKQNPIHFGALLLQVEGDPPSSLSGHYWTDRESWGQLLTMERRLDLYPNFQMAKDAFTAS